MNNIPDWISALCSILTLIFAYRIYRKFDLDKKFAEKRFDAVLEFANFLEDKKYRLVKYTNSLPGTSLLNIEFVNIIHLSNINQNNAWIQDDIKNSKLVIHMNHYVGDDILNFGYKMFLPKQLAHEIKRLSNSEMYKVPFEKIDFSNIEQYVFLEIIGKKTFVESQDEYTICNAAPYSSVMAFVNRHIIIRNQLNDWLKEHGGNDLNI